MIHLRNVSKVNNTLQWYVPRAFLDNILFDYRFAQIANVIYMKMALNNKFNPLMKLNDCWPFGVV